MCTNRPTVTRELGLPFFTRSPHPEFQANTGLILGLELPAPHAVLDTGSEWISWVGFVVTVPNRGTFVTNR